MKLSSSFSLNDSPGAWNNRYRLTEVFGERSYRPVKWNSALRPEISPTGKCRTALWAYHPPLGESDLPRLANSRQIAFERKLHHDWPEVALGEAPFEEYRPVPAGSSKAVSG
jgi:hypothetical protein